MLKSCTLTFMDALPAPTVAAPRLPEPLPALPPNLTRRQENYARCVAAGMSYAEAFRQAGCVASTAGSQHRQIVDLNSTPKVRARIAELKMRADDETVDNLRERMSWLRLIISAKPDELSRVECFPCDVCWTDHDIARAYSAHFAPTPFHEERPALPSFAKPRHDCLKCRGAGISRVVITPTDELSPAGRALFTGATQDKDGVIKIQMHDQQAASDQLNKLNSAYVQRSLNINANVAVTAARDANPADALKLFEAFGS